MDVPVIRYIMDINYLIGLWMLTREIFERRERKGKVIVIGDHLDSC